MRATADVADVLQDTPATFWSAVGDRSGISRSQFLEYFSVRTTGNVVVLPAARSLFQLRLAIPGFSPPQIYCYLDRGEADLIGITGTYW